MVPGKTATLDLSVLEIINNHRSIAEQATMLECVVSREDEPLSLEVAAPKVWQVDVSPCTASNKRGGATLAIGARVD